MSNITFWDAIAIFTGLGLWIGLVLFANASANDFRMRIQLKHPELWDSLGKPEFFYTTQKARDELFKFWLSRRYRTISDPDLTRLGDRSFLAYGFVLVFAGLLFLKFVVFR